MNKRTKCGFRFVCVAEENRNVDVPGRSANMTCGPGLSRHTELLENVVDVMFDGRHAQAQKVADLLVRKAAAK
jgi:hypothetical protein